MAFSPRRPLLPGMPIMPPGAAYSLMHTTLPVMSAPMVFAPSHLPPPPTYVGMPTHIQAPHLHPPQSTQPAVIVKPPQTGFIPFRRTKEPKGPPVTVFIGNIPECAPDGMIRLIINSCGTVLNWKRVQGASGRLQAFGFCEFSNPDAALRCMRLLHDMELSNKKLVAKVDANAHDVLAKFKDEKRVECGTSSSSTQDCNSRQSAAESASAETASASNHADEETYLNPDMKADDEDTRNRINQILDDYALEMANFEDKHKNVPSAPEAVMEKLDQIRASLNPMPPSNLDNMSDLEEDKKHIITREIGKFRDNTKRQDLEDKERAYRGDSRHGYSSQHVSTRRSRSPGDSRSPGYDGGRNRSNMGRSPSGYSRSRESKYSGSASRNSESSRKSSREVYRDQEKDEELRKRKKQERKAREKEESYQERLRTWEAREVKRRKEITKDNEREKQREMDAVREANKLREFLEDYDDERDDYKYYKGRELQRRINARAREINEDASDRQREKKDIEELRVRVQQQGLDDPSDEFERMRAEQEELYKPRVLVKLPAANTVTAVANSTANCVNDVTKSLAEPSHSMDRSYAPSASQTAAPLQHAASSHAAADRGQHVQQAEDVHEQDVVLIDGAAVADDFSCSLGADKHLLAGRSVGAPERQVLDEECRHTSGADVPSGGLPGVTSAEFTNVSRDVSECSSVSENDVTRLDAPSDCAVTVPHETASDGCVDDPATTQQSGTSMTFSLVGARTVKKLNAVNDVFNNEDDEGDQSAKRRKLHSLDPEDENRKKEEKKRLIKLIIDKIPTDKLQLFAYDIDWDVVDNQLMKERIRPWICRKIVEYIGEPEPTLVEFICSKILIGSTPQAILDDVEMVLDDEADVFVVKMWRLLIYEIEAKKQGLVKL